MRTFSPFSTSITSKLSLAAIVALLAVAGGEFAYGRVLQSRQQATALHADSLEVSLDHTRAVLVGLDQNRSFWQRRSYQSDMKADSLDKALKLEGKTRERLSLVIDSLSTRLVGNVIVDGNGTRSSDFHVYKPPFHVDVAVSLPAPPDTGVAQVSVALDTAHVGVRVGCGKAVDGIKPTQVSVSTPKWITVNVDSAETDVGVCNPKKARSKWAWALGAGTLLGFLLH